MLITVTASPRGQMCCLRFRLEAKISRPPTIVEAANGNIVSSCIDTQLAPVDPRDPERGNKGGRHGETLACGVAHETVFFKRFYSPCSVAVLKEII